MTHTPGPWIEKNSTYRDRTEIIAEENAKIIKIGSVIGNKETREYNVALIISAPEMLEMLKEIYAKSIAVTSASLAPEMLKILKEIGTEAVAVTSASLDRRLRVLIAKAEGNY